MLLCLLCAVGLQAKEKNARVGASVDERVELLRVVFRLAGNPEYSEKRAKAYVEDIEKWFEPYKEDTLIRYVHYLRRELGTGYDAVAWMAVSLQGKGGEYYLPQNIRESLFGGGRWNKWNIQEFVPLLNDFYKKTRFDKFFKAHKGWYKHLVDRFERQVNFNRAWYPAFYGEPSESDYRIILGCSNGGSNYGPSVVPDDGSRKTVYAIMGCWTFGQDGKADFSKHAPTLIHEFNHSFVNHLMNEDGNRPRMEPAGEKIISVLENEMSVQAYRAWGTALNESLVRAAVVRYMRDNGFSDEAVGRAIATECNRYYLWTPGLDSLLGVYSANREKYPSLRSFYPHIIEFFDSVAQNIDEMKADFDARCVQVVAVGPFADGAQEVDPSLTEMTVTFSSPLTERQVGLYSLGYTEREWDMFPSAKVLGFTDESRRTVRIGLKLEPGREYGMSFGLGRGSSSGEYGYPLRWQEMHFKTKGK